MSKKNIGIGLLVACLVSFGSCKPKQSAYKSVYEAAKERELEENNMSSNTNIYSPKTDNPSYITPSSYESVRKEKLTPATDTDARNLRSFSVVVAAMALKPSAESLRQRLENDGYNVILARNEQDMFRVIIASCNTKDEAIAKKNEILSDFASKGDFSMLKGRYGIPFNDWWILQREY